MTDTTLVKELNKWRKGIIRQIVDDEAVAICPKECSVQPAQLNVASLMPDINFHLNKRSDGVIRKDPFEFVSRSSMESTNTKLGDQVEEVFCHKDVEAFMENNSEMFQHNGDLKEASKILHCVGLLGNSICSDKFGESPQPVRKCGTAGLNENVVASLIERQASSNSNCGNLPTSGIGCGSLLAINSNPSCGNLAANSNPSSGSLALNSNPSDGSLAIISNPSCGNLASNPSSGDLAINSNSSGGNLAINSNPSGGNLATMARTGRGSRYLQSLLVTTPASIPQIFGEMMADAVSTMTHPKACFVVQKLLEVANLVMINQMVQVITDNFTFLSLNPYGCHVVQKALTISPNPLMMVIQLENYRDLMTMLRSPHGTHVAQACLPLLPPRTYTFIINAVRGQVVDLGSDQHGTYFLQKMVDIGASLGEGIDGNNTSIIVMEILKQVGSLAHNQNGTWLVQSVLKCGDVAVGRLAHWVLANLLAIYKSQPAMFLALALVQKLREKCKMSQSWASLLGELVIAMVDHQVAGRPLLVAAALHQIGHLLAREVARQVTYLGHGRARDRVVEVVTRYKDILRSNSYGNLVLKGLHEASGSYNMAAQN